MKKLLKKHTKCLEHVQLNNCINRFLILWLVYGIILDDCQVYGINENNSLTPFFETSSTTMSGMNFVSTQENSTRNKTFFKLNENKNISDVKKHQRQKLYKNRVNNTKKTNEETFLKFRQSKKTKSNDSKSLSSTYQSSFLLRQHSNKTLKQKFKKIALIPTAKGKSSSNKSLKERHKKLSKVSILGLFEMTTLMGERREGKSELAASELAVKHINERGLLRGYTLELINNDTQVTYLTKLL